MQNRSEQNYMARVYSAWAERANFESELSTLSAGHPDQSRKNLYTAIHELVTAADEQVLNFLVPFLLDLQNRQMSIPHFLNLLSHTHAAEYVFLIYKYKLNNGELGNGMLGTNYADFTVEDWRRAIQLLVHTETTIEHEDAIVSPAVEASLELQERSTQTFQISRYHGPMIFLESVGMTDNLNIADVGCSLGIALNMMRNGLRVSSNIDDSIELERNNLRLTYDRAFAYDIETILEPESVNWILACCAYPGESRTTYPKLLEEYVRFKPRPDDGVTYVTGQAGDMMNLSNQGENFLDVVITNTTLYQLTSEKVKEFLEVATKTLRTGGWIIISDFVHIENGELVFADSWFGANGEAAARTYRTVVATRLESGELGPWNEIFQYPNARCSSIHPGDDYSSFYK